LLLFVATVRRKQLAPGDVLLDESTQKTTQKTTQKILGLITKEPGITRQQLAEALGITADGVKYHLRKLQEQRLLRRVGPDKGGHWVVVPRDDGPRSKQRK
jgi:ATP-dependent DNA helicase RecG